MSTMKRPYQITALVLFFFAALVAYESLQLKFYTPLGPGPGFFPLWLSLALAGLTGAMFHQATYGKPEPMAPDFFDSKLGYLRALAICGAWTWATVMLVPLGYRLTMLVFFPFLLLSLGRVKWTTILLFTVIGSLVAYGLFTRVLRVNLPPGPFDDIFSPIDNLFESLLTIFPD
jgi:putative tricarboxylic transport membrane protein